MKQEILDTALEQFLKCGIREMSIQKLVSPLGISTKTVYKYFQNKEDLLEKALHLFYARQYKLLEEISGEQSAVTLLFDVWYKGIELEYKVSKKFFEDMHRYYAKLEVKIEAMIAKKFWKKFLHIIRRGISGNVFREDVMPEAVLEGMSLLYLSIVRERRFKKLGISFYDIVLNTIAPYVRGICTQKGIRELDKHISGYNEFIKM